MLEGYGQEHLSADVDLFGHLNPRMKVEIVLEPQDLEKVLEVIQTTISSADRDSAGTIFISEIERVIKIPKTGG